MARTEREWLELHCGQGASDSTGPRLLPHRKQGQGSARHRAPIDELRLNLLRSAAPSLAAAWFIQRGCHVSWPLEPCPYDLVVDISRVLYRIQVKTATGRDAATGAWACGLLQNGNHKNSPYDPDDIDFFFIVDGDGGYYLVPIEDVVGQGQVNLNTLEYRRISNGS